ncbi:ribonuclease III [Ornithobacterium rhinotracheale]|nr:ribonuclease III [Ornithobacterium rhinotracheale]MRJ10679.1 ribonuclease III [Ornithobacterium rhinotracheale]
MFLQNFWNKAFSSPKKRENKADLPKKLLDLLGFTPKNSSLFIEALTPRSAQLKSAKGEAFNYERLEFLGDAMLSAIIAEYLFVNAPNQKEGYLTKMRAKIVSRKQLNQIGNDIGLLSLIDSDVKKKVTLGANITGDMYESLIGAIYEDQGYEITKEFIYKSVITPYVNLESLENKIASYKSLMLEWCQKNRVKLRFKTEEEDNAENIKVFASILFLDEKEIAKGRATSKKKAEEKAAKRAYFNFQKEISEQCL